MESGRMKSVYKGQGRRRKSQFRGPMSNSTWLATKGNRIRRSWRKFMIGWIEMCLIFSCYTHTHTHTHTAVGRFHLFNLWFLAENGGRLLIKKESLVSDPKIKSQPDKEEEPHV